MDMVLWTENVLKWIVIRMNTRRNGKKTKEEKNINETISEWMCTF